MKRNRVVATFSAALALAIAFADSHPAAAQGGPGTNCPTSKYFEAWVDPFHGADGTAVVDDKTHPYATLNRAISDVRSAVTAGTGSGKTGLVHALPGLYADDNPIPQTFPIRMRPAVDVQGVGAKECVLRVRSHNSFLSPYWPLRTGLVRRPSTSIAVDFTQQSGAEPSMFDGFTIQGADIQVYAETEFGPRSGIVSNCVFDMRHHGYEQIDGPYFGVLVAAIWFGENHITYHDMPFYLFNNTFLQGVRYSTTVTETARPESVAICNCNDPTPPTTFPIPNWDPNTTIRGVSPLHVQNNLIRVLDNAPRTAMLGIDRDDTRVIVSSRPGSYNSNAFNAPLVGGVSIDAAGTFASAIVGGAPVPVLDMQAPDPGFVGEFESSSGVPGSRQRDARLLPDSVLRDLGASPAWTAGACSAQFVAGNGRIYTDVTRASARSSFDFDGDGLGNPRVVGADVDIGFDEIDLCVVSGCYGNDTKSHHLPYDTTMGVDSVGIPRIPTGTPQRDYIFAAPTTFAFVTQLIDFATLRAFWGLPPGLDQVWTTTGFWTHMPGSVAFRTPNLAPGAPVGIPGIEFWLDMFGVFTNLPTVAINAGSFSTMPSTWVNLESGQMHSFNTFRWTVDETLTPNLPTYFTQQVFTFNGATFVSSNLTAEYL
ncbi:MAG: hypothetical protein K8S98_09205 [Planctomycetes bacterium]|nr:hypothetical protein [Planctomycetota bacterium]